MRHLDRGIRGKSSGLGGTVVALALAVLATGFTPLRAADEEQSPAPADLKRLELHPPKLQLQGNRGRVQLVLTGFAEKSEHDLTRTVAMTSSNPSVAVVENGVVLPRGNGSAEIIAKVGALEARGQIEVRDYETAIPVSFEYGALAALSKQGCNAGACHGSPSGKGGFRLSLRAFDPKLDELTLIREDFGRRANMVDPARSLLLLKPLMKVAHGGGKKLSTTDPAYAILRDWIAEGCRTDPETQPRCEKIEIYPPSGKLLKFPASKQQFSVLAHFSDGTVRDVTQLAVFTSSDEQVVSIDENGLATGHDRGEAAVVVRYLEFIESAFITFVRDIDGFVWNSPPQHNYVDTAIDAKLKQLQFLPSDLCSDEEFLRRVYLDVTGLLPTIEQAAAFLKDDSSDKRGRLIDDLLERPEHAKFWALKWGDLLRLTNAQVTSTGVYKYHRWVERAIRTNMPYDEFARELLTASGSTLTNPPANFYRTAADTNDCVETISQVFLGSRLQCAKCHNHPFERWTQDNYYGMAAFFNRVQRKNTPRSDEMFVWVAGTGEVTQPRTGQQMKPWLPLAGDVDSPDPLDRRKSFADWLTQPENPFFAKIEVNRIWSHLFGRGIVEPADDFRESNPPSNAELLDALAKDFAESGFDRKHVIRTILNSRAYQTSFQPNDFNRDDTKYFSHFQPRLLSAEQLLDAICHVTGIPEAFGTLPAGTKATQLPAPDLVKHEFLKIFGQPERQTVCACERTSESNLGMAIQFFNGPLIYNKLRDGKNRFRISLADKSNEELIRELHLAAMSRAPTEAEMQISLKHIANKHGELQAEKVQTEQRIKQLQAEAAAKRSAARLAVMKTKLAAVPEVLRGDVEAALGVEEAKRTEVQKYLVTKFAQALAVSDEEVKKTLGEEGEKQIAELEKQAAELAKKDYSPEAIRIVALEDVCWALLNTNEFLFQH